ncbi:hypothetical protein ANN_24558 [Periplaneta americana]|uniref:Uncharacterized protein n=1 Tax=Periplaneta americana TaxID=6978 RepID=A0ABQ8S3C7_PERAM|nr:hypothetical protein ANN_24558 [Periplaneta americana]
MAGLCERGNNPLGSLKALKLKEIDFNCCSSNSSRISFFFMSEGTGRPLSKVRTAVREEDWFAFFFSVILDGV